MELGDAVRRRRMVRRYQQGRPVDPDVLSRLVALAVRAPSAGHSQGRDLLVLVSPQEREVFWRTTAEPDQPDAWLAGMMTAPVLVVCLADPAAYRGRYAQADKTGSGREGTDPALWPVPWWDVDTALAAQLLLLGAVDEGLGACLFGVPASRHDAVRAAFDVPHDRRVVAVVSLGHPDHPDHPDHLPGSPLDDHRPDHRGSRAGRGRRPLGEVVHAGRFGRPWPPSGAP